MKRWQASLSGWITHFSAPRQIVAGGQAAPSSSLSLSPELIVGRDLCRYVCLDLAHVPAARRAQAVAHQVEVHSPWKQVEYRAAWQDGNAQLWLWSTDSVDKALAASSQSGLAALRNRSALRLPETVFYPRDQHDGLCLLACQRGYDLQYWRGGCLRASRWYPQVPDAAALQWFARAQGLDSNIAMPAVSRPALASRPWPGARPPAWHWWVVNRRGALAGLVMLSLLVASLQGTAGLRWWWLAQSDTRQAAALEASATDLLRARGEARRARQRLEELQQLFNVPQALAAQWLITARMPETLDYEIIQWDRTLENIEMVFKAELTDTLSVVRSISGPGITDVTVEPWRRPGHYHLRLRLAQAPQQVVAAEAVSTNNAQDSDGRNAR